MKTALFTFLTVPLLAAASFHEKTIANDLTGGYQVVAADLNSDGKIDLIAVASGQSELVWYENPAWTRHVIATGQQRMINAAWWNGQIALASMFGNEPEKSTGTVAILTPAAGPALPWNIRTIDQLTTSHRLRWADPEGTGKRILVNAPLAGAQAKAPDYDAPVPLVSYRAPDWKREPINAANHGVQHGILVVDWDNNGRDDLLTASFSGIHLYQPSARGEWKRTELAKGSPAKCPACGPSDIAVGDLRKNRFLAAIEPWHGNQLAVYRSKHGKWVRQVIDETLSQGHTVLTADFDRDGQDEIVAGYRGREGGVLLYRQNAKGDWFRSTIDKTLPANSCLTADLDGDGRLDLACIGAQFLKWYRNEPD